MPYFNIPGVIPPLPEPARQPDNRSGAKITPWRQVEGMLIEAARTVEGLKDEPSPFVLKTALSDFYVEYQLNAVLTAPDQRIRVLDRLHAAILDTFNKYGVQITSPHYIADPSDTKVVPRDRWRIPPAAAD